MRSFSFDGKIYSSLKAFSTAHNVSYSKLRRLCRLYRRAHENPSVACSWILGRELLNSAKEPKTLQYYQDKEKGRARYERFIDKVENSLLDSLCL